MDLLFAVGVRRCLRALKISQSSQQSFAAKILLLFNVGLLFVDHMHFQYNGFLFGILLLSISFLLEERYLLSAFTFAALLMFKHIFLYMAPAFAVYLLKFYCLDSKCARNAVICIIKLAVVGLTPIVAAFGPFYNQLDQVRIYIFQKVQRNYSYVLFRYLVAYFPSNVAWHMLIGRQISGRSIILPTKLLPNCYAFQIQLSLQPLLVLCKSLNHSSCLI